MSEDREHEGLTGRSGNGSPDNHKDPDSSLPDTTYLEGVRALVEFAWRRHDSQRVDGESREYIDMRVGYYVNVALEPSRLKDAAVPSGVQSYVDSVTDELRENFDSVITSRIREDFAERLTREIKDYIETRIAESIKFPQFCLIFSTVLVLLVIGAGIAAIAGVFG